MLLTKSERVNVVHIGGENREAERGGKGGVHENPCAALSLANVVVRDAVGHIGYDLIVTRQHRSYDNHNIGQDSCHYWG